jgi:hypothetical protein
MRIDKRIFPDLTQVSTAKLVQNLARGSLGFLVFGALTGGFFAVAFTGGTECLLPWQWALCGSVLLSFIVLMVVGMSQMLKTITDRIQQDQRKDSLPSSASRL